MKHFTILAVLTALTVFAFAPQASAQAVPSIRGLQAFSPQVQYLSLAGYLRWQSYKENSVWISQQEARELVRSQESTTKYSRID